jgi:hypothetical protein
MEMKWYVRGDDFVFLCCTSFRWANVVLIRYLQLYRWRYEKGEIPISKDNSLHGCEQTSIGEDYEVAY